MHGDAKCIHIIFLGLKVQIFEALCRLSFDARYFFAPVKELPKQKTLAFDVLSFDVR